MEKKKMCFKKKYVVLFIILLVAFFLVVGSALIWAAGGGYQYLQSYRSAGGGTTQITTVTGKNRNIVNETAIDYLIPNNTVAEWNAFSSHLPPDVSIECPDGGCDCSDIISCSGSCNYSGRAYPLVQIGSQCWMARNLWLSTQISGSLEQTANGVIDYYCYNNNSDYCLNSVGWPWHGGLYQWDEAMQYITNNGAQGICPSGWHIPTTGEWDALIANQGGASVAAAKLTDTHYSGGTNTSGFYATLGGMRNLSPGFEGYGLSGSYWSSTVNSTNAYYYQIAPGYMVSFNSAPHTNGFFVRCILGSGTVGSGGSPSDE